MTAQKDVRAFGGTPLQKPGSRRESTGHIANRLRKDCIDMIWNSKAGHIGGDLSVMDILTTLYFDIMNVSPDNWTDPNRDRFLLSKGHCTDALYCVLAEKGFFDKAECIQTFGQFGSVYIGHPNNEVPGIEMNSGSLGHGLSVGAGMALAAKRLNRPYRVYVVAGDGEMEEGSNYEAMMAAAHYGLDNLCLTIDLNGLQISGPTKEVMNSDSMAEKFESFGWNVIEVMDPHNCESLKAAYLQAADSLGQPTVVIAHTTKGKGVSFMENNPGWHHGVLNESQYKQAKAELEALLV